jgi:hypothetical protein
MVSAGNSLAIQGQFFPPNSDPTTLLLYLERDTTSACNGGATELESAAASGQKRTQRLPANGNASSCASRYEVSNLTVATAYQFRARDCDMVTCSPWSAPLNLTTGAADPEKGKVVLTLDGNTPLGRATITDQGTFEATVTIPAGTTTGTHTIHAVNGDAKADVSVQVTASDSGEPVATITLTGSYYGETGCPTHPLPDYGQGVTTDETFSLFGTGFAPGTVTIALDSATGMSLGTATARADGSFCEASLMGPPSSQIGNHTLVAVQNGAVLATIPVKVVPPEVIH